MLAYNCTCTWQFNNVIFGTNTFDNILLFCWTVFALDRNYVVPWGKCSCVPIVGSHRRLLADIESQPEFAIPHRILQLVSDYSEDASN